MTTDDTDQQQPAEPESEPWYAFLFRDRVALTIGSVACVLLTLWLGKTLDVPAVPERAGILLQQPSWPIAIASAWLAVIVGAAIGTILSAREHYDAGLFCACVGLAGLSIRSGPAQFALFAASGPAIYLAMGIELILLLVVIAGVWSLLHLLSSSGKLPAENILDPDEPDEPLDQKLLATGAQTMLTIILMMILCQSDAKPQTLASVALASYLGALGGHHFVMTRPSVWFWIGPFIVALIGYVSQYFGPSNWQIGEMRGFFAPLARPMPLDYASLGTAGALLGYWTSQRWHHERRAIESAT
jgi:hypothetical protein